MTFLSPETLQGISWQAFERLVARLLLHEGFDGVRLVGESNDGGADVLAHRRGKRWLVQAKRWSARVGNATVDRTLEAMRTYRAHVPVIVSLAGFEDGVRDRMASLHHSGAPMQLWDRTELLRRGSKLADSPPMLREDARPARPYQERAITRVLERMIAKEPNRALVVMATGLGKTYVAAEIVRRLRVNRSARVLALAHTNPLVNQLERSFWPFLTAQDDTLQWNGIERPTVRRINACNTVFGCNPTVLDALRRSEPLEAFDVVIVDECHHGGSATYLELFERLEAGTRHGPFLLGLTATPWHVNEDALRDSFGEPVATVDVVTGLREGFLANVDYRMYTDNINWEGLRDLHGERFSPKTINKAFFLPQWDDGVAIELKRLFEVTKEPRAIVFCATIDHAVRMRDRLNALKFCSAAAIYTGSSAIAPRILPYDRNRVLCDFQDNITNVICAVDIFNEGIDVPDVNIIVFQRITHSRRIFIQQLGRGLRLAPGKTKVTVLDFVSDIRRFAAGIELKDSVTGTAVRAGTLITLPHNVSFERVGSKDPQAEAFLREWLMDIAAIEGASENAAVLHFPPPPPEVR